jgi:hypothetical protein
MWRVAKMARKGRKDRVMSAPCRQSVLWQGKSCWFPYLKAEPRVVARWRERLAELTNPGGGARRIGLVWAGQSRPEQPDAERANRRRSMSLAQLAPLGAVPGVRYVSLQKGAPAAEAQTAPAALRLVDWTDELQDFADTATLVEALDLIITVDTSVAHLAGALGKPVWLLNRLDTCWRWLLEREDTRWYPGMRIFRQRTAGDWDEVIARVGEQLAVSS